MRTSIRLTSVLLGLAAGPVLVAQSATGSLNGAVLTNNGQPLVGAKVIVSSKALFAPKVFTTDEKGEWRAMLLPPGEYKIMATKDGYLGSAAENVRVGLGTALRQDLRLQPQVVQGATVAVVASASAAGVDKTDTKSAVNYSASQLEVMPTGGGDRAFNGALSLAPGVVTNTPSGRPSVRGGNTQGLSYSLNGADIKNDYQSEMGEANSERWVVEDNIEDIQVVLSPLHPRFGLAQGGSLNVVTKSGSNDFRASLRNTFSRDVWRAKGPDSTDTPRPDTIQSTWQATVGGPIVRDRLWFSVATVMTPESASLNSFGWGGARPARAPWATGDANIDRVTGAFTSASEPARGLGVPTGFSFTNGDVNAQFSQVRKSRFLEFKLSGAIVADHVVELAVMRAHDEKTNTDANDDCWNTNRIAALGTLENERYSNALSYRGVLSNDLFLEARYAETGRKKTVPKGDTNYGGGQFSYYAYGSSSNGYFPTEVNDYGVRAGMLFGVHAAPGKTESKATTFSVNLKWLKDAHEFDFGLDGHASDYMTDSFINAGQRGSQNLLFSTGGQFINSAGEFLFPAIRFTRLGDFKSGEDPAFLGIGGWAYGLAPTMIQYLGPKNAHLKNDDLGLYASDLWTVNNHWNVLFGLRIDKQTLKDSIRELANATSVAPRLQVRYDIDGDSRSLVTLSYGQFVGDYTLAFASGFGATAVGSGVRWGFTHNGSEAMPTPGVAEATTINGVQMYGVRFVPFSVLTNPANYRQAYAFFDSASDKVVENLKPPVLHEITLGYQRSFQDGSNVRFTYVNRDWKRNYAIWRSYGANEQVLLQDPSGSGLPGMYALRTHYGNSDDLKRQYNGLEIEWNVKSKGIWAWGGSWSYSRLTGNDEDGEAVGEGSSLRNNNPNPLLNYRDVLSSRVPTARYAPDGRLNQDVTHRIRLHATATVPILKRGEISFSWMASAAMGGVWGATTTSTLGAAGVPNLTDLPAPNPAFVPYASETYPVHLGATRNPFERGSLYSVNFRLAFRVPLPLWKTELFGDVYVNNFINNIRPGLYQADNTLGTDANGHLADVNNTLGTMNWVDYRTWTPPRSYTASVGIRF